MIDDDAVEGWFFSLEPECRQCSYCGDHIARSEAENHFDGRCKISPQNYATVTNSPELKNIKIINSS